MQFLTNLNLNQNELQNAIMQPLSTPPASPKMGQVYFNSGDKLLYVYDGTQWGAVGSPYILPTMSTTVKGGAIVGNGLVMGTGDGINNLNLGTPSTLTPSTINNVSGTTHTHAITGFEPTISLTANSAVISDANGKLSTSTTTASELEYVHGVTSGIQSQLNSKQATITGAASTVTTNNLAANYALVSDANGKIGASGVTATELGYVSGVIGPIQGQIDNIPKYNYLTGLSSSGTLDPDTATQTQINNIILPVIQAAYTSPSKWDAVVVSFTFLPSDVKKDLMYYYNGTAWVFLYYMTTGVQLANGTTAGLIQEADANSDLSLTAGVATVNVATQLRNIRAFSISGEVTAEARSFNGTANVALSVTSLNVSDKSVVISAGDKLIISDSSNNKDISESTLGFGTSSTTFLANNGTWATPVNTDTNVTTLELDTTSAEYPVLTQGTTGTGSVNGMAGKDSNVTINPATGTLSALSFSGTLSGTASRATADASGNVITSSYASSLSAVGTTVTLKSKSGDVLSTISTQDTDTTYTLPVGVAGTGYAAQLILTASTGATNPVSLVSGSNVTITLDTTNNKITFSSNAGVTSVATGTDLTGGPITTTGTISHANITNTSTTNSGTVASGGTFTALTTLTVSATGHVTAYNTKTYTIPTIPKAVTRTVVTMPTTTNTVTSSAIAGYILSVLVVDSITKAQVYADVVFSAPTGTDGTVTVTTAANPSNALNIIITSIAA